jgi:hypothetical protein
MPPRSLSGADVERIEGVVELRHGGPPLEALVAGLPAGLDPDR